MVRSLVSWLVLAAFLPVVSPPAGELPGSGSSAPLPFGVGTSESTSVAVPGQPDLPIAAGFS